MAYTCCSGFVTVIAIIGVVVVLSGRSRKTINIIATILSTTATRTFTVDDDGNDNN